MCFNNTHFILLPFFQITNMNTKLIGIFALCHIER